RVVCHVRHIFINHGDSEKLVNLGKNYRIYDEFWVAGHAQIDRFVNSGIDFLSLGFRVVGRPQARPLIEQSDATPHSLFAYLPTWEGYQDKQNYTSAALMGDVLDEIAQLGQADAAVKLHPYPGQRIKALRDIERQVAGEANTLGALLHQPGDTPPESAADPAVHILDRYESATQLMANAAFLITDVSSVVSDFLITGRPIFLYMPPGDEIGLAASSVPLDSYCYVFATPDELLEHVRTVVVEGRDSLRDARLQARNYFIDIERTVDHRFEKELRKLMVGSSDDASPRKQTLVVAHRGVASRAPQNSLTAFRDAAALQGPDAVEFDVHMAADGAVVIMHDALLQRTSNGQGGIG